MVVERVLAAVALQPPTRPIPGIAGLFSLHGAPVPVLDIGRRLGVGRRQPSLTGRLIVVSGAGRRLAIAADGTAGIADPDFGSSAVDPTAAVGSIPEGVVQVVEASTLLSPAIAARLDALLGRRAA